ncbi:hypothetical protein C8R44DRAFT_803220 [Mycena epipterygia]|nr:hypothetical protein C8R44DRAFT_803220 [Mycena epipterygia]
MKLPGRLVLVLALPPPYDEGENPPGVVGAEAEFHPALRLRLTMLPRRDGAALEYALPLVLPNVLPEAEAEAKARPVRNAPASVLTSTTCLRTAFSGCPGGRKHSSASSARVPSAAEAPLGDLEWDLDFELEDLEWELGEDWEE